MAGSLRPDDPEVLGQGDSPTKSQMRLPGLAENKETGGSPFAPCEIRRSTKLKNQELPPTKLLPFAERIGDRSAYISMIALVSSNCSPRLGPQDPVNRATIIASAGESTLQLSNP
jgi:hypothetical protein